MLWYYFKRISWIIFTFNNIVSNDTDIFKQVIEGLMPPMPSVVIDHQNIPNLLIYLQSW